MPEAHAVVHILSSGFPSYLETPEKKQHINWPSSSILLSSLLKPLLNIAAPTPFPRETVFLSRSQQRIMDSALRRSLRIIA